VIFVKVRFSVYMTGNRKRTIACHVELFSHDEFLRAHHDRE